MKEWSGRRQAIRLFDSLATTHPLYPWHVLFTVMLGTFMVVLDGTIVNVTIPTITIAFGELLHQVVWVVTAYLISLSVVLAASAWVSDRIGAKRAYLLGLLIFFISSYLCGIAWNLSALIAFRIIQGIGGGILIPVGMILFVKEFKKENRNVALGIYSISVAAAISLGPSIGGYLIQYTNWRWVFFINLPISIVTFFYAGLVLKRSAIKKITSFDGWGFFTFTGFLVFLFIGISSGNAPWNVKGWESAFTLRVFFLSLVCLIIFIYIQFMHPHPLIDLKILKDRNFLLGNIILFIFSFTLFGSSFLLPLYLQNGIKYSQLQTGFILLPIGIAQGIFSGISGWLTKVIPANFLMIGGIVTLGLTYQFNSYFTFYTKETMMLIVFVIRGAAMGLLFAPLVALSLSTIAESKIPQATGIFSIQRQIGAALGVAIFETFLIIRRTYHTMAFGSSIDPNSPLFGTLQEEIQEKFTPYLDPIEALLPIQSFITEAVENRAFIQAIDDNIFFAGIITIFSCIPLFFSIRNKPLPSNNSENRF